MDGINKEEEGLEGKNSLLTALEYLTTGAVSVIILLSLLNLGRIREKVLPLEKAVSSEQIRAPTLDELVDFNIRRIIKEEDKRRAFNQAYENILPYKQYFEEASQKYNIDIHFLEALCMAESGGDAYAESSRGAVGLMQLMEETAIHDGKLKVNDKVDERTSPKSIIAGARVISIKRRYLKERLVVSPEDEDAWYPLITVAYNWGEHNLIRAVKKYPDASIVELFSHVPEESYNLVIRVGSRMEIIKNPEKYGFSLNGNYAMTPLRGGKGM